MNKWFLKNLGDGIVASEPLACLEQAFSLQYASAGRPQDMALFIRHESAGQLHCDVRVYFSPAAVAVAREFDAKPCGRPSANGLGLLAGSVEAWLALFP